MATTVTIPLTTLAVGQVVNVPATSVAGLSSALLAINRNVGAFSLDATPTAVIDAILEWSQDGGATWLPQHDGFRTVGGQAWKDKAHTVLQEVSSIEVTTYPGATHVRATITNGPAQISVSGSLTLS